MMFEKVKGICHQTSFAELTFDDKCLFSKSCFGFIPKLFMWCISQRRHNGGDVSHNGGEHII